MASLRAKSRLPSSRIITVAGRIVSLFLFVALFVAGLIGLSYVRSVIASRSQKANVSTMDLRPVVISSPPYATSQFKLVYSTEGDAKYYHTAAHSPSRSSRSALSEQAARERGLKPCPICFRPR
ncbi:MAG: hypothetical protein ACREDR_41565 [Blastocatellia bacterium]